MRLFLRILTIVFACLAASAAAGLVVTLAVLLPELSDLPLGPLERGTVGLMVGFAVIFLSAHALVPALLVVVCAEAFAIRSALFYAVAGALLGAVLFFNVAGWEVSAVSVRGFARRQVEIMAAAGIVAGFVYWLIAGRNAGRWRERPPSGDRA